MFVDDSLCVYIEVFAAARTTRPPTQAPIIPSVPEIGPLTASILSSDDKLFFISHRVPVSAMTEWTLACVYLQQSVQAHPAALQDGRFLVDFFTCHCSDRYYNAINKYYCIKYHPVLSIANPHRKHITHLICPSA